MLEKYIKQILNIENFIDGLLVTDKFGYIEYYLTFRPDLSCLSADEVTGKHILDVYPNDEANSSIMQVLKKGKPIYNKYEEVRTFKGDIRRLVVNVLPIISKNKVIGAVDVSRYIVDGYEKHINLSVSDSYIIKKNNELFNLSDIVSRSASITKIKKQIEMISQTDSSVLIYGETGTGKELIAQAIHFHSLRSSNPFISQNCAAIPESLLESTMFGTEKGAYTGSTSQKGLFELAQHGTLFLDEIDTMNYTLQAKMLKAIEEKKVRRLGGDRVIDLDLRIISATNKDPASLVQKETLRQDLFFRLGIVQIKIPPLRERLDDIMPLVNHFINFYNQTYKRNVHGVSSEVEELFLKHTWPGNVRELRNIIESTFNFVTDQIIKPDDLPEHFRPATDSSEGYIGSTDGIDLKSKIEEYEKNLIMESIKKADSFAEAAKDIGLSKQALNYKMGKYKLKNQ